MEGLALSPDLRRLSGEGIVQQPVAQLLGVRPHEFHSACVGAPDRILAQSVLDSMVSEHSKRNYAKAFDHLFELFAGAAD